MDDKTERVQARAYAIWEAEGRPHGQHEDHWRRAHEEMGLEIDPMTAAILPQATLLEPDVAAAENIPAAARRSKK